MAVGAVVNNRKVGKHFAIEIGDNGVRSNVFLCMLAYHVEWHLRDALAPLLFHDTELAAARAERSLPVSSTEPSDAAKAKKATKRSADGHRVMCFALSSTPTRLQEAAFRLLQLEPLRVQ